MYLSNYWNVLFPLLKCFFIAQESSQDQIVITFKSECNFFISPCQSCPMFRCICLNIEMYLFIYYNVFVHILKYICSYIECICSNIEIYLLIYWNIFVMAQLSLPDQIVIRGPSESGTFLSGLRCQSCPQAPRPPSAWDY